MHSANERVSSVDLIKSSQTDTETSPQEREAEVSLQRGSAEPTHPLPPWLQHRESDPGMCDRGYQGREEEGGSVGHQDKSAGVHREEEIEDDKLGNEVGMGGVTGGGYESAVLEYEASFVAEVQKFVQKNSDMFDIITEKDLVVEATPTLHNLKSEESRKPVM